MPRIAVIGAGQLGSRHIQALALLPQPLSIHVIDPSEPSLAVAKARWESVAAGRVAAHELTLSTNYHALPKELDLCIVATGAGVRRVAIESTLRQARVRYLVLEKILFPVVEDYAKVGALLEETSTPTWVNCNMRMIPFFRDLKGISGTGPVHYSVAGSRVRVASNLIHHIDFVNYLTGVEKFELDLSLMDDHLVESKRKGYADWEGICTVKFADGSLHAHTSWGAGDAPIMLSIFSREMRFIHRSGEGKSWISTLAGGWAWTEYATVFPMQSTLTADLAKSLLVTGDCDLPRYDLSSRLHVTTIEAFRMELKRLGLITNDTVPFT